MHIFNCFLNSERAIPFRPIYRSKALMVVWLLSIVTGFCACSDDDDTSGEVKVQTISDRLAAVRDYVPLYAVIAHRGSTYWAPEETESAWRWAREMGARYRQNSAGNSHRFEDDQVFHLKSNLLGTLCCW